MEWGRSNPKSQRDHGALTLKWQGRSRQLKTPEISRGTVELRGIVITALNRGLNKEVYTGKLMMSEAVPDEWPCAVTNPGP